jgi:heparan-alpha-glucosaminide N-acetyltransferase
MQQYQATQPTAQARIQEMPFVPAPRVDSLDILRGLTVLVMLFVNDLAGVAGVPAWMKHIQPSTADGMTFVDVVFPAFLFIVGLSLPLAIERRFSRGESISSVAGHIGIRVASLLVIGVFMVNSDNASHQGWLHPAVWVLLFYGAVCLVWMNLPGVRRSGWFRIAGLALLVVLAFAFRGPGSQTALLELRPSWWGILGLIGWAYLVASVIYLVARRNAVVLAGVIPLLYCVYFADQVGFFTSFSAIDRWVDIGSMLGSHAAITTSGALLGLSLVAPARSHRSRLISAILIGSAFAVAGTLLHSLHALDRMFIYNKNAATPAWCLLSSAWTAWLWAGIYWLIEVSGLRQGTGWVRCAGQNALFAFILGPIAYTLVSLPGIRYPHAWLGARFSTGLLRSIAFAVAATCLTGLLQHRRLALKL